MKTKIIFAAVMMLLAPILNASGACKPPQETIAMVSGRTYVELKTLNDEHPRYLSFDNTYEQTASYGSAVDGHPGGVYHYKANCHGEVIVTFTSFFGADPKPIKLFKLRPTNHEYFYLEANDETNTVFKIVIE